MPKNLFIDPNEVKKPGTITFDPIPVNQFSTPFSESRKLYTDDELITVYRDMYLIRAFESMLFEIKKFGSFHGIDFRYEGPLHLSVGQESCAVGQAFLLTKDDWVFGSHRSHGEVLAKGLSTLRKLPDAELTRIMKEYDGGTVLNIVSAGQTSVRDLCEDYLLYGVLAEILALKTGFQKGLSGSMHAFFPPFGTYPNNAIVGASAPIAVGAALYKKINRQPGMVISNVGDGALGRGPVWEAMNFSAMDQFHTLWERSMQGGLPILFNFFNNFYGMGGQTVGETMAFGQLARIGAGISPTQLYAERVDGSDPLAVIDAMRRKKALIEQKKAPVLLDVITYRIASHSASDHESYRTPEEIRSWAQQDPIAAYHKKLIDNKVCKEEDLRQITCSVDEKISRIFSLCADPKITPAAVASDGEEVSRYIFSNQRVLRCADRPCEVLLKKEENPRLRAISAKSRSGLDDDGNRLSKDRCVQLRDAVFEAVLDAFYEDPTLIAYGEEVRDWGGPYGVYEGLTEALPYHRFFNSPISESTIVASAVGYAMAGGRAVVELPFCDFLGCAGDEIFNQLSKWQFMSAGHLRMPVVLRIAVGSLYGTQHAQDFSAMAAHVPGLKVVYPATPYDAKGLLTSALRGTDPVVFFESQDLYDVGEWFRPEGVPEGSYEIPLGKPDIKREGSDLTILTVGPALYTALEAAQTLERLGCSVEIIDARCLVPFDYTVLLESVRKTGRLLLAANDVERGSWIKDVAQAVTEHAFDSLKCAPVTYACRNWIAPTGEVSRNYFPDAKGIVDLVHYRLFPLNCYTPAKGDDCAAALERSAKGI